MKLEIQYKEIIGLKKAKQNSEIENTNANEAIAMKTMIPIPTQTITKVVEVDITNNTESCNSIPSPPHNNTVEHYKNGVNTLIAEPEKKKTFADIVNMMKPHTNATRNERNNDFINVTYKKKNSPIFGTKQPTKKSIAGQRTIRKINLFIGGVSKGVTPDELAAYMKEELNVEPTKIIINKQNEFNQSFKVEIRSTDKKLVFCPEAWENNIVVKSFREKRYSENEFGNRISRRGEIDNESISSTWR